MVDLICSKVGQRQQNIRRDSNLSLALGIWLGGALMLGGFLFAEPIVAILLGKGLSPAELRELALVAKVGIMQIPVTIVAALCNKLSIAVGRSSQVMYSSLLAFAVNFALNLFLVPQVGILGIGVGSLVGGIFSLIVVFVGVYRQIGLSPRDTFVALGSLLAWVAVCIGLSSGSVAASIVATIMLGLTARLQWRLIVSQNQRGER
jgi:O-antigen/teichoic acid export membrane protein